MNGISLDEAVGIWFGSRPPEGDHLALETLDQLSLTNGMATAPEAALNHLATCRVCMEKWECFTLARQKKQGIDPKGEIMVYGQLKAAASESEGAEKLKSHCGRFVLGISREEGDAPLHGLVSGLITLDVVSDRPLVEGRRVRGRDAAGSIFMDSRIRRGKAAVETQGLDQYDFSTWTLAISTPSDTGDNG